MALDNYITGEEETTFRRRLPCVERKISEIRPEDMRVRITGTVIDKSEDKLVIDDGSGRITVIFDSPVDVKPNQFVRVFGRVIPLENGFELMGEIVQDMSRLDPELYKKVQDIQKEFM
ncbi:MAG: replication protein RepA [Candidatus Aenigmatarchaeota archaeon]|nr:MAG: replication protein RepA [Candidatus Aenigmarchaeota archaeon]